MALHFLLTGPTGSLLTEKTAARAGESVVLTGAEAHHAASVRRVRVGEDVTIGDGRGTWLTGECVTVSPREVVVRIDGRVDLSPLSPRLVLAQALAKGDRDELAVQAATELGVDEIVPWQAARSVSRWDGGGGKAEKGRARWATIVREAAKQAHRAWVPEVTAVATTAALATRAAASRVVVLEPSASIRLTDLAFDDQEGQDVVVVVGPEGGIAPEELTALERAGASLARLGDTVLRTSTAGPAALAVISAALRRW
jgi:16S rRNA (uracil1498-N3)-methyltransferase